MIIAWNLRRSFPQENVYFSVILMHVQRTHRFTPIEYDIIDTLLSGSDKSFWAQLKLYVAEEFEQNKLFYATSKFFYTVVAVVVVIFFISLFLDFELYFNSRPKNHAKRYCFVGQIKWCSQLSGNVTANTDVCLVSSQMRRTRVAEETD